MVGLVVGVGARVLFACPCLLRDSTLWLLGNHNLIVLFVLSSPAPSTLPPKEEEWNDVPSDVVHLTDSTFDDFIANNPSVLVMFYAPCEYEYTVCV